MRFFADENCEAALIAALRSAGHDVDLVSDQIPSEDEEVVLSFARQEQRVVITEDRDFGQLVFRAGMGTVGVLYLRFPVEARRALIRSVLAVCRGLWQPIGRCIYCYSA